MENFCKEFVRKYLCEKLMDAIPELERQQRRDKIEVEKLGKQIEWLNEEKERLEEENNEA